MEKPLKITPDGVVSQMGTGDQIPPANLGTGAATGQKFLRDDGVWATPASGGGGSATISEVVLDFGSDPVRAKSFAFEDVNAVTSSRVVMTTVAPGDGRSLDEMEMDAITCAAVCLADGFISVVATAHPGPVTGQYKFNYLLG